MTIALLLDSLVGRRAIVRPFTWWRARFEVSEIFGGRDLWRAGKTGANSGFGERRKGLRPYRRNFFHTPGTLRPENQGETAPGRPVLALPAPADPSGDPQTTARASANLRGGPERTP